MSKGTSLLLLLSLLLLAAIFTGPMILPQAHAGGYPSSPGLVCLNDSSHVPAPPADPCPSPSTPYTFNGPFPSAPQLAPSQVRVGVYINGSDRMDGFDITLLTNNAVLKPAGVDLTGTVLLGVPVILVECLNGVKVQGSACSPATDVLGTLHLAATSAIGSPNTLAPTTGLLFTALFNITATSPAGGASLSFQTGCSATSAGGGVCVTIANGSPPPPPPINVQGGNIFDNSVNPTWVAITSNSTSVSALKGSAVGNHVAITATAENGFPGILSVDTVAFSAVVGNGIATTPFAAPTLSAPSCSTAGLSCSIVATVSTTVSGSYAVTVFGTYVGDANDGVHSYTLAGPVSFVVNIQDIGWTIGGLPFGSGQTVFMAKTQGSPLLLVTVQSLGGYSGTIAYSQATLIPGATGMTMASFMYPAPFTLGAFQTVTKAINATAPFEGSALYKTQLAASGLSNQVSGLITIKVSGFGIATNSSSVSFLSGGSGHVLVTVNSLGNPASTKGFAGTVVISNNVVTSTGGTLTVSCSSPLTLTAGGTASGICSVTGTTPGSYNVTITGTGGTNNDMTNSTDVTLMITSIGPVPGINLSASPTSMTVNAGTAATSTISVAARGSFTGTVNFSTNIMPTTGLSCTLSLVSVSVPPAATLTLSCAGSQGIYAVTVNAVSGTTTNSTSVTVTLQDFTVVASPTSVTVTAGVNRTSMITVSPQNGFTSTVVLGVATNSTSLVCSLSSTSLTGGSGSSTLSCHGSPVGNYLATVTGSSGTLSHSADVVYHVTPTPDFAISASPTSVTVNTGLAGTSTITVAPVNGFSDTVALVVTTNSTNLQCFPSSASITGGSGTSTLSCTGSAGGNYLANVTGTSGGVSHSATVIYDITTIPNFTISASSSGVSVNAGVVANSTITIAPFNGFAGTVALAVTTNSTDLSCTLSASTITGGSGTSTLSCTSTVAGNYLATVTGTSGSLSHFTTITCHVRDFALTTNPTTVAARAGSAGTSTITVIPLNGFVGTMTLAVTTNSTNLSCTLSVMTISGGSGTSTLSCTGSAQAYYLATIMGTNGTLSHSTSVIYAVTNPPIFTVTANPTSVVVNAGVAGTSTITVTPQNGFMGTVTLSVTTNSTSISCTFSSTSITGGSGTSTLSCTSTQRGNYLATVTGTNPTVSPTPASATVTYQIQDFAISASSTVVSMDAGNSENVTITVTGLQGFTGTVSLTASQYLGLGATLSPSIIAGSGTSTISLTGVTLGNYTLMVTGTAGSLTHTVNIVVRVGDFGIFSSALQITVFERSSGFYQVSLSSENGFAGSISLVGGVVKPPGSFSGGVPIVSLSQSTVTLTSGGSQTITVVVNVGSDVLPNLFAITVNASIGTNVHSAVPASLTVPVPKFSIVSTPASVTIGPSVYGSSTIKISSEGGLNGTVSLLPLSYSKSGLNCNLDVPSVSLGVGGSVALTLSCVGSVGSYNVTIAGQGTTPYGASVKQFGYAGFVVADFSLSTIPNGILVNTSQDGHAMISISWTNNYDGTVVLSLAPQSGLNASITSSTVTGHGSANVTVVSNSAGVYSLIVTGTSGSSSHSITITVTVASTSPSGAANILGLDPAVFYSGLGVLIVAGGAVTLMSRRRKRSRK